MQCGAVLSLQLLAVEKLAKNIIKEVYSAMQSEKIVELAVEAGFKVDEYENHVCISVSVSCKVVFPRATYLHETIAEFIKKLLGF